MSTQDYLAAGRCVGHFTKLFDESVADRALAFRRRLRDAVSRCVHVVTPGQNSAEQIGVGAFAHVCFRNIVAMVGTSVGNKAYGLEDTIPIEQRRDHYGKAHFGGAGPARDFAVEVARAGDILEFVVIFEIDLVQAIRFGAAAREVRPAGEAKAWRSAVRTAGKRTELLHAGLGCNRLAEFEVPDSGPVQVLRLGGVRPGEDEHDESGAKQ